MPTLSGRKKVAIVGFCQTSREYAPYLDETFEIWGLNRGYLFMPRADRWFDMHSGSIIGSQERRPGKHIAFLQQFNGPVYVHQIFDFLGPNQVVYPLKEVAENLGGSLWRIGKNQKDAKGKETYNHDVPVHNTAGEPYLSSSIAYELALAIVEGFEEIHMYGVDLNTESEYAWQKPGVEWLMGVAAGRGIKVVLPDNCPLGRGTLYGRGFVSERPEQMSYEQLAVRKASLQREIGIHQTNAAKAQGALESILHFQEQMIPGIDHELVDMRRKQMEKIIHEQQLAIIRNEGALKETVYWEHQTMAGQDPVEAIEQLRGNNAYDEGPLTDIDEMTISGEQWKYRQFAADAGDAVAKSVSDMNLRDPADGIYINGVRQAREQELAANSMQEKLAAVQLLSTPVAE